MEKKLIITVCLNKHYVRDKSVRDPATRPETADLRWKDVETKSYLILLSNLRKYHNVSQSANNISIQYLCFKI